MVEWGLAGWGSAGDGWWRGENGKPRPGFAVYTRTQLSVPPAATARAIWPDMEVATLWILGLVAPEFW